MKKKLIILGAFIATNLMAVQLTSAKIVLVLGDGVDQGSYNRDVRVGDCVDKTVAVACDASGTSKCPTNADIRANCPGAWIVPWIPMGQIDTKIQDIQALWNHGLGETSGSTSQVFMNAGQAVQVSYSWTTLLSGELRIVIDSAIIPFIPL